ncbi:MAG: HAMP domain-containing sensor histidine kinase [Myxococcota bacterium]
MGAFSIHRALAGVAALLAVVTLLTVSGLLATSGLLRQATEVQETALESVRAAEEVEASLLLAQRAERLQTADAQAAWLVVDEWLDRVAVYVTTPEEAELVHQLDAEVTRLRRSWDDPAEPGALSEADAELSHTLPTVEALVELNLAQAAEAQAAVLRWSSRAEGWSTVLALLLVGAVGLGLLSVRALLFRPIDALRSAMGRFGAGDLEARVPLERQPEELAEVARTFNDMADALARQREMQLALVASVAHDLRNPLFALQLSARAAERRADASEGERRLARQFGGQLRDVNRMLEDLVDASRIEAGHVELQVGPTDVRSLAASCVALYADSSPGHEVVLAGEPAEIVATVDATRVSQVLANLVSNAIKYSPGGGRIEVALEDDADEVGIRVTDHGVGITPDEQRRVFEPFRRGTGKEHSGGAGLGLSVCKRIVEAHGGRIGLDSTPGAGTTVRVRLPRSAERADAR